MEATRARMAAGGRIVIPAAFRAALDLQEGDELRVELTDGELRLVPLARAIQRAQDLVAQYVPRDRSLVDELIAERRREAARE